MIFYLIVFGLGFVQNAVFTAVSRSRNSGDVLHHAKWAVASNALWFVMQIFIVSALWDAIKSQEYVGLVFTGIIYVAGTSLGSVAMMRRMLKTETGKRKVGARPTTASVRDNKLNERKLNATYINTNNRKA